MKKGGLDMKRIAALVLVTIVLIFTMVSASAEGIILDDYGALPEKGNTGVGMLLEKGFYTISVYNQKTKDISKIVAFEEVPYFWSGMMLGEAEIVAAFLLGLKPEEKVKIYYNSEHDGYFMLIPYPDGGSCEVRLELIIDNTRVALGNFAQTIYWYLNEGRQTRSSTSVYVHRGALLFF
jgi:hypothetical protein